MADTTAYDKILLGRANEQELKDRVGEIIDYEFVIAKDTNKAFYKGEDGLLHSVVPDQDLTPLENGINTNKTGIATNKNNIAINKAEITKKISALLGKEPRGDISQALSWTVDDYVWDDATHKYYRCTVANQDDFIDLLKWEVASLDELRKKISGAIFVVESGSNSNGWWRLYSDGWLEQGGYKAQNTGNPKTITLPKEYLDTTYNISQNGALPFVTNYEGTIATDGKTTTSFKVRYYDQQPATYWETKGFAKGGN